MGDRFLGGCFEGVGWGFYDDYEDLDLTIYFYGHRVELGGIRGGFFCARFGEFGI